MEFSNSILLWTSIAGLLPVIIHLLNKEKPKPVSIPTVKFILKAVEKSAGKRKVNSLLLLAIRILILLTLSFLIAKPFFAEPKHQQNSDIYTVLIIDNSFYTSHTNSEGTQFNKIKNTALKIINELPHGAYISISDNDAPSPFTNIKDYAKNKITTLPISNNYIDIHSKIQQAITLLNTQKVKGKIFIISDLNKGAWNENYQLPENNRHKITVIPISQRKGNIFINEVFTQDASGQNITKIHANRSFYFSISVMGDRLLKGTTVSLTIDNQEINEQVILEESNSANLKLNHSFAKAGTYRCKIEIHSEDGIVADNIYYLTLKISPPDNIVIIHSGNKSALYLKAALSPSGWHGKQRFNTSLLTKLEFNDTSLNSTGIIILTGYMALSDSQWQLLNQFLDNGGHIIFAPDEHSNPEVINQSFFPFFQTNLVLYRKNLQVIADTENQHNFLSSSLKGKLTSLQTKQNFTLHSTENSNDYKSLLKYSDGHTALAQSMLHEGRVYFFGLCPGTEFTNLLSSNTFAVLWHQFINYCSPKAQLQKNFFCDKEIELWATPAEAKLFKVSSPGGTVDQIPQNSFTQNGKLLTSSYSSTPIAGHYTCTSDILPGFSCNLRRAPNYSFFPNQEVIQEFGENIRSTDVKTHEVSFISKDTPLQLLILLSFCLFMLETHLANRRHCYA